MFAESVTVVKGPLAGDERRPEASPIDLEHLARYTLGDRDLQREIFGLFRDQLDGSLARLADAPDVAAWRMAAHTLKGSARGVGAFRVGAAAEAAERVWTIGPRARHTRRIAVVLRELDCAARDVRAFIATY
ncbi:MAG: Hpt domain-containing protein [Hyphomicrobiaceae bacterium]|nr:Hpt domain-containing protein [Hyphomicrobiaceae bacterium]